jgi:dTDP-4-dehydrorhamnose 3,5-epimerase
MIFTETNLKGAGVIEPERLEAERRHFAEPCCQRKFKAHGLAVVWVQENISFTPRKGTVRGMHVSLATAVGE